MSTTGIGRGNTAQRVLVQLLSFYGLGAAITALASFALARVLIRSERDAARLRDEAAAVTAAARLREERDRAQAETEQASQARVATEREHQQAQLETRTIAEQREQLRAGGTPSAEPATAAPAYQPTAALNGTNRPPSRHMSQVNRCWRGQPAATPPASRRRCLANARRPRSAANIRPRPEGRCSDVFAGLGLGLLLIDDGPSSSIPNHADSRSRRPELRRRLPLPHAASGHASPAADARQVGQGIRCTPERRLEFRTEVGRLSFDHISVGDGASSWRSVAVTRSR